MGCVSYGKDFFPNGRISDDNYRRAYDKARLLLAPIRHEYHARNWQDCVGSSGTVRTIELLVGLHGGCTSGIDRPGLRKLEKKLLKFRTMDDINLEGLAEQRRNVILPGMAIISALFDVLGIERMRTSTGALREGVIYDLMGRLSHEDVRERSINALMQRYSVDTETADIVERRARVFFDAARRAWQLDTQDRELLRWTARTHELGLAIARILGICDRLLDESKDWLLQMDIEGGEYEVIFSMSEQLLKKYRIIIIEFHMLDYLLDESFFRLASRAFRKLLVHHRCVHVHPNNAGGVMTAGEIIMPKIMEFTFHRIDRIKPVNNPQAFPHPMDSDNVLNFPKLVLPDYWRA
jgi:hypothetical protein